MAIELLCRKHPRYRGMRTPKTTCQVCWHMWRMVNSKKLAGMRARHGR